jgi:hypothetical protein
MEWGKMRQNSRGQWKENILFEYLLGKLFEKGLGQMEVNWMMANCLRQTVKDSFTFTYSGLGWTIGEIFFSKIVKEGTTTIIKRHNLAEKVIVGFAF